MENLKWRKSSRSGSNGEMCVEVARTPLGEIAARDSKNRAGGMLVFSRAAVGHFLADVRHGRYDLGTAL